MESVLYTLEELIEKSGEKGSKIKTLRHRGKLEHVMVPKGERQVVRYTQGALDYLLGERSSNNYKALRDEWEKAQKSGIHTGTPLKERTVKENLLFLKGYWDRLGIQESIQGISPDNFDKVIEKIGVDEKKRKDHHALKLKIYNTIASFYRHLIKRGFKTEVELLDFRRRRPKKKPFPIRRTVLKEGQLAQLLQANESLKGRTRFDRALMKTLLLLYTCSGMRKSEALTLECDWINFKTGEMRVLGKDQVWRDVQAGPELLAQMNEWYTKWRPKSKYPHFILQKNGIPQTSTAVQTRMTRLRQNAGGIDITTHGLRRTFATMVGESGMAPTRIQSVMGHKRLSTTDLYLLTDSKAAAREMSKVDFKINPEMPQQAAPKKKRIRDEWS